MKPLISICIPARNEFPNIVHTFHSIMNCLEADGFGPNDAEVILIDNASTDTDPVKPGVKGTSSYLMPRGAYWNRTVRVIYDPIAGNHSARNKGAEIAYGKYLFFSDAHMAYRPGYFKNMIKAVDESGGLVHGSLNFMGAYPPKPSSTGYGYTLKLGEEWKGTWNPYVVNPDKFFAVPGQGHWGLAVDRQQFLDFGGYPEIHRTYGGGETFVDSLWWMMGSCVVTEPKAIGYHLASSRGYSYEHDDYKHNVLNCSYALGADWWMERAKLNWMRHGRKEVMDRLYAEAKIEMAPRRKIIEKRRVMTFNEMVVNKPWDKWNMEHHGKTNSAMSIFHWSWLELLRQAPDYVKKAYLESEFQQQLGEFIEANLKEYIYKGPDFEKKYGLETLQRWRKTLEF